MARQFATLGQLVPQLVAHRKAQAASPWAPLWSTFPDYSTSEFVRLVLPDLLVHRLKIENRPTSKDPLGVRAAFELTWQANRMGEYEVQCSVHGQASPRLTPQALQAWLCVEYPDTFRVGGGDG